MNTENYEHVLQKKTKKQKKTRENAEEIIPQQKIVKREHNSEGT